MTSLRHLFSRLNADSRGAGAVEFAIIAPALFALLVGVMQVGIAMQSYNAMRNVSADVARYAMVQYSTGNRLSNNQLKTYAISSSRGAPYLLEPSRLRASVTDATVQRVAGAKELTLTIDYQVSTMMSEVGLDGPTLSYSRPIFLTSD